jgi:pantoate--beta-alanine ligase
VEALRGLAQGIIARKQDVLIDYLEFCDSSTLGSVARADDSTLMALAVKVGKTRLIDNCLLSQKQ